MIPVIVGLLAFVALSLACLVVVVRRRVRMLELWMCAHDERLEVLEGPRTRKRAALHLERRQP